MKKIPMVIINRIKACDSRIFEAMDDDYPNNKKVAANERAIEHYLKDYTEEEKRELREYINWENDDCAYTLTCLGWEVTKGVN